MQAYILPISEKIIQPILALLKFSVISIVNCQLIALLIILMNSFNR